MEGHAGHLARAAHALVRFVHVQNVHQEGVDVHDAFGHGRDGLLVFGRKLRGEVRPPFLQRGGAGTAGREDVLDAAAHKFTTDDVEVLPRFQHEAGTVAGSERGNAAAGEIRGHDHAHAVMLEHLEAGFAELGVVLVGHAAGKEQHLDARLTFGVQVSVFGVKRLGRQLRDVARADELLEKRHVVGLCAFLTHDQPLEGGGAAHHGAEQLRMGQQFTEDELLDGVEPAVVHKGLTGLHEDFQNGNAGRTVGLAGAAQKAAVQLFLHRVGVLNHFMSEVVEQGQLAAAHVGFSVGHAEHRADGLAQAAAHAVGQPVVQLHQCLCKTGDVAHGYIPVILQALNRPLGSMARRMR